MDGVAGWLACLEVRYEVSIANQLLTGSEAVILGISKPNLKAVLSAIEESTDGGDGWSSHQAGSNRNQKPCIPQTTFISFVAK